MTQKTAGMEYRGGGGKIESKTDDVPALLSEPTMNHKALIARLEPARNSNYFPISIPDADKTNNQKISSSQKCH